MKNIFTFIMKAYQEPRLFMQFISVKFKQVWKVAIVSILLVTTFSTFANLTQFNEIATDISSAAKYLPNYDYQDGKLKLANDAKPLYYQSENFNLIVDDSIQSFLSPDIILIETAKIKSINPSTLLGLYLFQDQTILAFNSQLYRIDNAQNQFLSRDVLINYLTALVENPLLSFGTQWVTYLIITFIAYWLQMLLLAFLASTFNRNLSTPITLTARLKLAVTMSFIPLILIQLIQLVAPGVIGSFLLLGISFLTYFFQAIKSHTLHIRQLLLKLSREEQFDFHELNDHYEELDYIDKAVLAKKVNKKIKLSENLFSKEELEALKKADLITEENELKEESDFDKQDDENKK